MDFGKLAKQAQEHAQRAIDKRGGNDALKQDLEELKDIAKGPGSASEKAKRAADALKDPGAKRRGQDGTGQPDRPTP